MRSPNDLNQWFPNWGAREMDIWGARGHLPYIAILQENDI